MCVLMYTALLRVSEVVALRWADISTNAGIIALTIRKAKNDQMGKGRTTFVKLPSNSMAEKIWRAWEAQKTSSLFVFPGRKTNIHPRTAANKICALFRDCGIENYTSHSLRAGAATAEAASGIPLSTVQRRGRWNSVQGMASYVNDSPGSQGGFTAVD